jgi:glycosyltransferase involved in cell wall biosynthesis
VIQFFDETGGRPIAMSLFGEKQLREGGLDPLYVPHGVDTNVMRPTDNRAQAREALRIPEDAYVVGMVANNQGFAPPRKAFPEAFEGFARFRKRHKDAFLYIHAEQSGVRNGLDLPVLAEMFGIQDVIRFAPQTEMELGIPQATMADVFSMMDVLLNPSYGEGFGIPIIEAQACGTPVIVTDWTSMPELCGAGWKVGGERWYDSGHGAFFLKPSVQHIASALQKAYEHSDKMGQKARDFALQYDADLITEKYWKPVLEELTQG